MHGNLYKIWRNGNVVAFITATNTAHALSIYTAERGRCGHVLLQRCDVSAEQLTHGYPQDTKIIYG